MVAYLIFMASPFIVYLIVELITGKKVTQDDRTKNIYLIVCGIIIALMIGMRNQHNGSGDTALYCSIYEKMSSIKLGELSSFIRNTDMEIGYLITTWLLSKVFIGGQWLLVLSGAFFSFSICYFVKNNCKNVVLALAIFNCLGLFNFMVQGLRQAIAMSICLCAFELCKKKKLIRFLLVVALASLFHASAIVFAMVYVFGSMRLDIRSLIWMGVGTCAVLIFLPQLFSLMSFFMNDDYSMSSGSDEGGWIAILIYVCILIYGLAFRDSENKDYPTYMFMLVAGTLCMVLRQSVSGILERMGHYFAFAQMAVVSNAIYGMNDKRMRAVVSMAVVVLCLGVALHKATYSSLVPYRFFWN